MFAVVDTETTGLSPNLRHRIAEIAVVLVDRHGRVESEWSTLVNPDRDLGPQHIHGISGADVVDAPRFSEIGAHVLDLLSGRVVVAHNFAFDRMFLEAEYDSLGVPFPLAKGMGLCTMTLSTRVLPGYGRSLRECCTAAHVALSGWHTALADARATAGLLSRYIELTDPNYPWAADVPRCIDARWPSLPACTFRTKARPLSGNASPEVSQPDFIDSLMDFMPRVDASDLADPYLAVLDQALSDRYLSMDESAALRALAQALGIQEDHAVSLHREYLNALARVALADHHLSREEEADLQRVAAILDLPGGAIAAALELARASNAPIKSADLALEEGDMIVFTGDMGEPREVWMQRAAELGYVPHPCVTKKVKLVVAADAHSLSGKAKKARGYGIPIMSVEDFRAALGIAAPAPTTTTFENWGNTEGMWARALRRRDR